jgi:RsiW-degrading membrane proteinase PrsW (M82 family)
MPAAWIRTASAALAVAPALLLVVYFYRLDRHRPEPKGLILLVFVAGLLATLPTIMLEVILDVTERVFRAGSLAAHAFRAFVVIALCEETMKLFVVRMLAYRHRAFDEVMDGIIYTVVASLGFACLENVLYVWQGGLPAAVGRAVTAVPMHAFMSGLMGYFVGRARFARTRGREMGLLAGGLLIAVVMHGLYDFCLFATPRLGPAMLIGPLVLVVAGYAAVRWAVRQAMADDVRCRRVAAVRETVG